MFRRQRMETSGPPRQWAVDVAVGAAVLTVGAGGVLTLLVSAGLAMTPIWGKTWFLSAISFFGLLAAVGLYMLAAVYFPWPLPQTRAAREARAELQFGTIRTLLEGPDHAVVEVPLSIGRLDIDNASINVLVPGTLTSRCTSRWTVREGPMTRSAPRRGDAGRPASSI